MSKPRPDLARLLDHTRLAPDTTREEIRRACAEARKYGFASVCIPSRFIGVAAESLNGSETAVGTVVGFPLGHASTAAKTAEAAQAVREGATEIDLVLPIGAVKEMEADEVREEIREIRRVSPGALIRVILETGYLTRREIVTACLWVREAGECWVKTSTGFGPRGATVADVHLMKKAMGEGGFVKAAGGIRNLRTAQSLIRAGAARIGSSRAVEIIKEFRRA